MNVAIIAAAGQGKRFGGEKLKQFLAFSGKPLIIHTLERFEKCREIDETILVLPGEEIENFLELSKTYNFKKNIKVVAGGKSRAESVCNGLMAIDAATAEIIAVHDGARPLISPEEISQTIEKAQKTGAACLVASVTDTIKEVSNNKIVRTIDRTNLRRALTPQAFQYKILRRAFAKDNFDPAATDESFLVEKLGIKVSPVEGNAQNIKITTPQDLVLAESLLKDFR